MSEPESFDLMQFGSDKPIAKLPPKWSQLLSAPPCTCHSREVMTEHFEDCPRYIAPPGKSTFIADVNVIGPDCFAAADESVICWKGVNYYRASGSS